MNIKDTSPIIINKFELCQLPIQVLSNYCNLGYELSQIKKGEYNKYKYELLFSNEFNVFN